MSPLKLDWLKMAAHLEKIARDPKLSPELKEKALVSARRLRKFLPMKRRVDERRRRNEIEQAFAAAADKSFWCHRNDLAYRHMLGLAETFESWVFDKRLNPIQTAKLLGWSESLRCLANEVGPLWNPPKPARLSAIALVGWATTGEER